MLHPDLKVCGEAEFEDDAVALIQEVRPDLVLVNISLKGGHGIDMIKRIRSLDPGIEMLVVSGFQESLYAERAFRAGALGYLNKPQSNEKLIKAIRTVLAGSTHTIDTHREKIRRKLTIKTAAELSLAAVQWFPENG